MQPMPGIDPQPLADQASHRQPTKMRTLNVQCIQQTEHVMTELLDAVRTRRHQRFAVATGIETQHAKVLGKRRHLRVPHVQISA
ncbi:hypothetical protein D3C81_1948870 [compost metagenome]